jgi:hypothetical protein
MPPAVYVSRGEVTRCFVFRLSIFFLSGKEDHFFRLGFVFFGLFAQPILSHSSISSSENKFPALFLFIERLRLFFSF